MKLKQIFSAIELYMSMYTKRELAYELAKLKRPELFMEEEE